MSKFEATKRIKNGNGKNDKKSRRPRRKKKIRTGRSKGEKQITEILKSFHYKVINEYKINGLPYDIYVKELNLVIEYHGTRWHFDPRFYEEDHYDKVTDQHAWKKWKKDEEKKKLAEDKGYKVVVIWQYDWMKLNKRKLIESILEDVNRRINENFGNTER